MSALLRKYRKYRIFGCAMTQDEAVWHANESTRENYPRVSYATNQRVSYATNQEEATHLTRIWLRPDDASDRQTGS